MVKGISFLFVFALTCGVVLAQNSNSSTTTERQRTTNTNRAAKPAPPPPQTEKAAAPKKASTAAEAPGAEGVNAAFNELLDGIRHAGPERPRPDARRYAPGRVSRPVGPWLARPPVRFCGRVVDPACSLGRARAEPHWGRHGNRRRSSPEWDAEKPHGSTRT